MSDPVLALGGVVRTFQQGRTTLEVLRGVDLELREGEIVALVGPSGSGKSTLLHIAGLLEKPDAGEVSICGESSRVFDDDARTRMRRHNIGFVYQYHHLLPEFSALENILIPQIIAGLDRVQARARAMELLQWMDLSDRSSHRPGELSRGDPAAGATARARANAPRRLRAEQPTGNLDPGTAGDVFSVLLRLSRGAGLAALVATHNPVLAARMDRTVRLEDGVLVSE